MNPAGDAWSRALATAEQMLTDGPGTLGDVGPELEGLVQGFLAGQTGIDLPDAEDVCYLARLFDHGGNNQLGLDLLLVARRRYSNPSDLARVSLGLAVLRCTNGAYRQAAIDLDGVVAAASVPKAMRYAAATSVAAACLAAGDIDETLDAMRRAEALRPVPADPATDLALAEVRLLVERMARPTSDDDESLIAWERAVAVAGLGDSLHDPQQLLHAVRYAELRYQHDRHSPDLHRHRASLIALETATQLLTATLGATDRVAIRVAVAAATAGFEFACRRGGRDEIRDAFERLRSRGLDQETSLGRLHPEAVVTRASVAVAGFEMARTNRSQDEAQRAAAILELTARDAASVLGREHPHTVMAFTNAASAGLELIYVDREDVRITAERASSAAVNLDRLAELASSVFGQAHSTTTLMRRQAGIAQALASQGAETAFGGGLAVATRTVTSADSLPSGDSSFGAGAYTSQESAAARIRERSSRPGHQDPPRRSRAVTYADAGFSIHAGERAVELLKSKVKKTTRPEVMGDLGGFAGLFRLNTAKYKSPILASSTDGVGTKLVIAQQLDIHDTIGIDLVAMVVDDLVACGAEPLFLLDYIACGEVVPDKVAEIGAGIADGCRYAGCALLGGETAEHPGVLRPDEYDVSATGVGVVEESEILGRDRVEIGDAVIAMRSSGLHSNGYSLVRHVLLGAGRMRLDTVVDDFGRQRTLGEELLTPTKIYAKDCLGLIEETDVRAFSHVTGGGIPGNLVRILPETVDAIVDRSTWRPQSIFDLIQAKGRIDDTEMEATFNMGVGMFAIVSSDDADRAMAYLTGRGVEAWQVGEVIEGTGQVQMVGQYTRG